MQRHGADIELESTPGTGTTIRLSFAIVSTAAADAVVSIATKPALPLRILVVDDDPVVLKSLRDALETDGHLVTAADGGRADIDALVAASAQSNPLQAVITDLAMPYVDGRKVSSVVKATAPGTLVVMLSGWGQRLVADGDVPPHVDRALSKPPKLRELREALAQGLDALS
jgi:CheY-like chemotaxis protein